MTSIWSRLIKSDLKLLFAREDCTVGFSGICVQWNCDWAPGVRRSASAARRPTRKYLPVADKVRPGKTRPTEGAWFLGAARVRARFHVPQRDRSNALPNHALRAHHPTATYSVHCNVVVLIPTYAYIYHQLSSSSSSTLHSTLIIIHN